MRHFLFEDKEYRINPRFRRCRNEQDSARALARVLRRFGSAKRITELRDMVDIFFNYVRLMHINILAYLPEIDPKLADAAFASATNRHNKFWDAFQDSLKNNPSFFERLLHKFYSGDDNGKN